MPGIEEQEQISPGGAGLRRAWEGVLEEAAVSVAWSSEGRWVAAASASGAIHVFSSSTEERCADGRHIALE
jgi:WD40 repeat protein